MNKKKLLLIVFFIGLPQVYGSDEPKDLSHRNPVRKKENDELTEEDLISKKGLVLRKEENEEQLKEKIKALSGLQAPLAKAEAHYDSVLKCLALLHEENQNFDQNCEILKNYLLELGYSEGNSDLQKVLQKNTGVNQQDKISLEARTQLFNTLDFNATQIRTNLIFTDFAERLTKLLVSKQFAPVEAPNVNQVFQNPNATLEWQENTRKLIDFIIADWELIKDGEINFGCDDLNLLLGMSEALVGQIDRLIFPLKKMTLDDFSARIDSGEKRTELLTLLEQVAGYLDWLKTEFAAREKVVNDTLYNKNENIMFTEYYNKKASIKTMHDDLDRIAVASRRYTKAIDFIFQKIGRLTPEQRIGGANSYIEAVKPVREIGGLLSVIGILNMGLSLRGHTLDGMKQSVLELKTYFKNKELKSAAKYVGASFNKKHLFGLLLPVGIGVAYYGNYKTDTLRQKRDRFKNVITELEKPYQKKFIPEEAA
jgi:hypothetical protein